MPHTNTNKVLEIFGYSTRHERSDWSDIVAKQWCPFTDTKCFKVRKSQADTSIGTCSVCYGRDNKNLIICPNRLLEHSQVFTDCLHLLTLHEPGNELHIVPEVSIPGGSVDYFLVSAKEAKVNDFAAIEFQTLDTTGTVWPERQRLLNELDLPAELSEEEAKKSFGMNWKMTAKTILVQLHHKVETLEHISKHFALVIQDYFLDYLKQEFDFAHLNNARTGDSTHIHAYSLAEQDEQFKLLLNTRLSTDAGGIAKCLGIQAETKLELGTITTELEKKISDTTRFTIGSTAQKNLAQKTAE